MLKRSSCFGIFFLVERSSAVLSCKQGSKNGHFMHACNLDLFPEKPSDRLTYAKITRCVSEFLMKQEVRHNSKKSRNVKVIVS